jgi:pilus assembly protein CpaF
MLGSQKKQLSVEDLRQIYFGTNANTQSHSERSNVAIAKLSSQLTPSAKYVIKEAKRLLGQKSAVEIESNPDEADLLRLINLVEANEGEDLSDFERTAAVAALSASLEHYDLLTPLIENPEINDIIVRAYNDISIQVDRKNIQTDLSFSDHETYKSFVENLLKRAGKSCTVATPVVDAAIDAHVRACVTHESFSPPGSGPMLTLRIARHHDVTIERLVQHELAPWIILNYLSSLVECGLCTMLIAGEVGTGKTTLIKALSSRIPQHEAVLIIEDTHEVSINRKFVRTLLTREPNTEGAGRITPAMAIRTGMRMAMNRLILSEMRDSEAAEAFIDVCASGHSGMSTIHARSAKDAIGRLELFLARSQGNVNNETIRRQIANAISVVVYLDIDKANKKRRIKEIIEIVGYSDGSIQYSPMFKFQEDTRLPEWSRLAGISSFNDTLKNSGIELPFSGQNISFDPEMLYGNF